MKKHESEKCAKCGADKDPGYILCHSCLIATDNIPYSPGPGGIILMEIFRGPRKIAELDITGWSDRDIARQFDIQIKLLNRNIKISAIKSPK